MKKSIDMRGTPGLVAAQKMGDARVSSLMDYGKGAATGRMSGSGPPISEQMPRDPFYTCGRGTKCRYGYARDSNIPTCPECGYNMTNQVPTPKGFDSAEQRRLIAHSLDKARENGGWTLDNIVMPIALDMIAYDQDFEGCDPEDLLEGIKAWLKDDLNRP